MVFAVDSVGDWLYSKTELPSNWFSPSFDTSTLSKGQLSTISTYSGSSIYLRKEINTLDSGDVSTMGANIYVTHKSGCIVYINGIEIYRRFLPL